MNPSHQSGSVSAKATEPVCPRCQEKGRKVSAVTVESLVKPKSLARAINHDGFYFCATPGCPVAYYRPTDGLTFAAPELRVAIFQKSADPNRLVCYCFRHAVSEIEEQVRTTGDSTVPADIKSKCAQGLDDCERNNPQGSCCLGNVQRVIKEARARFGPTGGGTRPSAVEDSSCCETHPATAPPRTAKADARSGRWAAGAVVTAALSSACCWLPLVLVAFGVPAAGVSGFFDKFRPWLLAATALILATGFYFAYFRQAQCAPGSTCAAPGSRWQRGQRALLWLMATFTLALAAFPNYAGRLLARSGQGPQPVLPAAAPIEFRVEGMTCAACAAGLEASLRKLPGVIRAQVDYSRRRALVQASPDARQAVISAVVQEVEVAGFHASARINTNHNQ